MHPQTCLRARIVSLALAVTLALSWLAGTSIPSVGAAASAASLHTPSHSALRASEGGPPPAH